MQREPGGTDDRLDVVFETLADRRRRHLLYRLRERDEAATVEELASELSGAVDVDPPAGGADAERRIAMALSHTHLPKLDDAGIVDHDERTGAVRYRGGRLVEQCLELARPVDVG